MGEATAARGPFNRQALSSKSQPLNEHSHNASSSTQGLKISTESTLPQANPSSSSSEGTRPFTQSVVRTRTTSRRHPPGFSIGGVACQTSVSAAPRGPGDPEVPFGLDEGFSTT